MAAANPHPNLGGRHECTPPPERSSMEVSSPVSRPSPTGGLRPALTSAPGTTPRQLSGEQQESRSLQVKSPRNQGNPESVVTCETVQQCSDFNVMTRREVCSADVSIRVGSGHVGAPLDCLTFVVALAGSATVRFAGGRVERLQRFDCVLLASAAELCVRSHGRAAVVRVKHRTGRRAR